MKERISEQLVAQIWQHQLVNGMVTDAGERVSVIFPGRLCNNGGDFCDAVFTIDDKVVTGNVEVHVRLSQWYSHGHHKDDKYNGVVLHIVMWRDCEAVTMLQNGGIVPSVFISAHLLYPFVDSFKINNLMYRHTPFCQKAMSYFSTESLSSILIAAGKERFVAKATAFKKALAVEDAGQVLFKGIARSLGYEKNIRPFEQLADILPLKVFGEVGYDERGLVHQALVLGSAGLLPFQRRCRNRTLSEIPHIGELEAIWRSLQINKVMNESDWCFFQVRPCNFPTRRLLALSFLVQRYSKNDFLESVLNLVSESQDGRENRRIVDGLVILNHDYWANHSDFRAVIPKTPALLGSGKAAEIAMNILLPFSYAWGALNSVSTLMEKAEKIHLNFPQQESNQLIRFMKQQLLLRPDFNLPAPQQQGLLHIFKTYCQRRDCEGCPINLN